MPHTLINASQNPANENAPTTSAAVPPLFFLTAEQCLSCPRLSTDTYGGVAENCCMNCAASFIPPREQA